jgi:hypothetical protein
MNSTHEYRRSEPKDVSAIIDAVIADIIAGKANARNDNTKTENDGRSVPEKD